MDVCITKENKVSMNEIIYCAFNDRSKSFKFRFKGWSVEENDGLSVRQLDQIGVN